MHFTIYCEGISINAGKIKLEVKRNRLETKSTENIDTLFKHETEFI